MITSAALWFFKPHFSYLLNHKEHFFVDLLCFPLSYRTTVFGSRHQVEHWPAEQGQCRTVKVPNLKSESGVWF